VVHVLFYVVILGMIASGIGMMVLSGAAPLIFGGESALLPDFWKYTPRVPHGIGARLLLALLVLHAGAALYHHFVRRDGLLWRMWFRRLQEAFPSEATLQEKEKNHDQDYPSGGWRCRDLSRLRLFASRRLSRNCSPLMRSLRSIRRPYHGVSCCSFRR